ncbi:FBP domain-containing protein [Rhizohabitans arisaemae]|uniref:FBP domain-containing protein n=1 Tax=Rhizohabitans arisaemae TaxID=2720610 RepID=UPI0024B19DD7|nr:FBP domain-containing protein [Rhizohabitans arisaemae]
MKSVSEHEIRTSFVNCSKGEAKRLPMPRSLKESPWADLDFLGWRDPAAPERGYLVAEHGDQLVGVTLRLSSHRRGLLHSGLCSLCLTTHPGTGVSLMAARKAGQAGRDSNSVGLYVCSDLACSLYVRGKKVPATGGRLRESLSLEEQIDRTTANLTAFLGKLFR